MTLVVTHTKVSTKPVGNDSTRIYSDSWNANHALTGTSDASQLNANVVQAVTNDTNIQGSIAAQTLTFSWAGTLAAARLNANVVQAITNDTNVTGSITAQNLTLAWTGQLGLSRGGTNADLSATGGAANYLKQASLGGAVTVGTIPASDIASGTALTKADDTNVTLTLGGTPTTALLKATSLTLGWTGTLAASRGGFGADVSAQSGVPLFSAGVPTFTSTSGSGNFVRVTNGVLVTPQLGTPQSGVLTNCTGLPLAGLATQAAWTFLVNNTSGSATPTAQDIHSLTVKASPASTDEVIIWDIAGAALKKATVSGIGASAGVSSIAGNTGAFTLTAPITNSTNAIVLNAPICPQGRLTLATLTPVMVTTQSGKGTIFYTPYQGNLVPIYDGTNMIPTAFSELSQLTTDATKSPAAVAASSVYDLFVWNDSGTLRCTRGPAWTNDTTRSAGTALTMVNGINLNNTSITNGPAASRGTYVGTVRSNGSSLIDYIFGAVAAGGTAGFFGVWNAYNRVNVGTFVGDSTATWTYAVANTWRATNGSATMRVTAVFGLNEDAIDAEYNAGSTSGAATVANNGVGLDSTTAFSGSAGYSNSSTVVNSATAQYSGLAGLGVHFVSAIEFNSTTTASTWLGGGASPAYQTGLHVKLRM